MIYLLFLQDKKKHFIPINSKNVLDSKFFHFFLELTKNKNVLYSYTFYKLNNNVFADRNNIVYIDKFKRHKIPIISGGITSSNINDIINFYYGKQQDIYVLVSSQNFYNLFIEYADYLIIYESNDETNIKYLTPTIDIINFGNYNFLASRTINKSASVYYFAKIDDIH